MTKIIGNELPEAHEDIVIMPDILSETLHSGTKNYDLDDFTIRAYSRKRTSECICQQCQSTGREKNLIGKLGDEFMTRLNKLTVPFDKLLTRNVSFKEENYGTDSLEALINNTLTNKTDQNIGFPEQKSCSSSCVTLQLDDTIPVSRKLIEETLLACIHLNSSTEVVGKLSEMMLRHFTASIMREIKQTFFTKLNALQYRKPTSEESSIFESESIKEDSCVGTELKFEDSQIVKSNIIQTEDKQMLKNNIIQTEDSQLLKNNTIQTEGKLVNFLNQKNKAVSVTTPRYLEEVPFKCQCNQRKTFICKLPNTQPFSFTMKTMANDKPHVDKEGSNDVLVELTKTVSYRDVHRNVV